VLRVRQISHPDERGEFLLPAASHGVDTHCPAERISAIAIWQSDYAIADLGNLRARPDVSMSRNRLKSN